MCRYLQQVACSLRPRSVGDVDLALRRFVAFVLEAPRHRSIMNHLTKITCIMPMSGHCRLGREFAW
jgi:hypothetical protein